MRKQEGDCHYLCLEKVNSVQCIPCVIDVAGDKKSIQAPTAPNPKDLEWHTGIYVNKFNQKQAMEDAKEESYGIFFVHYRKRQYLMIRSRE